MKVDIKETIKRESAGDKKYEVALFEMYEKFKGDDLQTLSGSPRYIDGLFGHENPLRVRVKASFFMIKYFQGIANEGRDHV